MTKTLFSTLSLAAILTLGTSCEKEDGSDVQNLSYTFPDGLTLNESWHVERYIDDYDETYVFAGYTFDFTSNGQVVANQGNQSASGSWGILNGMSVARFYLSFGNHPVLSELNEDDWKVIQKNDSIIELRDDEELLIFKRGTSPASGSGAVSSNDSTMLGNWTVDLFMEDGFENETYEWNGMQLQFSPGQLQIVRNNGNVAASGQWFTSLYNNQKMLVIRINGPDPIYELDDEWLVTDMGNGVIELVEPYDPQSDRFRLKRQ